MIQNHQANLRLKLKLSLNQPSKQIPPKTSRIEVKKVDLTPSELADFEQLKAQMKKARNVLLWNQLRRFAKKKYSSKIISMLDASGLIHQTLQRKTTYRLR